MHGKCRVLVVADVSAEQVLGGAERVLTHHLRALQQAGHHVELLTRQPSADAPLSATVCGSIREHRLPYHGHRGWQGLNQLRSEASVWWSKHGDDFDVVVAEQPFTIWALLKAGCRLPRLQVCHSFAFEEYAMRHGHGGGLTHRLAAMAMKRLERKVYHSANELLVLSMFMRKRLRSFFDIPDNMTTIVPGGVSVLPQPEQARDEVRRRLGWDGPMVVTLRNLVPRTGVDLLVEAAGRMSWINPELRWCVIGEGALMPQLQAQATALGVSRRIEFTGYLNEQEVAERLFAADIFMLPTRDLEGFGLVTLEANACGLPVIATPVAANREVVPSLPYNRLASAVSAEALADAVASMLEDGILDDEARQSLRKAVDAKYSWRHHDAAFVKAVEALIR